MPQSFAMTQQQRQTMQLAPQQLQSLEMLQAPALELRAMIQKEMETNPVLEDVSMPQETSLDVPADMPSAAGVEPGDVQLLPDARPSEARVADVAADAVADSVADDLSGGAQAWDGSPRDGGSRDDRPAGASDDGAGPEGAGGEEGLGDFGGRSQDWDDAPYQEQLAGEVPNEEAEERRRFLFDSLAREDPHPDHLLAQLSIEDIPPQDRIVAEILVGDIDEDGYLRETLDALEEQVGVGPARISSAIAVLQDLDPPGVAARDLRECLRLQLDRRPASPESLLARDIVGKHFDLLARRKYAQIARVTRRSPGEVEAALALVRSLDPSPGRSFRHGDNPVVVPEILVRYDREADRYVAEADDSLLPRFRVSMDYERMFLDPGTPEPVRSKLREYLASARNLRKSLAQRQDTIARIAGAIVDSQQEFFAKGVAYLRPMTMADIAARVEVHETTVSRTVANKYMRLPSGAVYELKYFFSPGLHTVGGADVSNKTIQGRIAAIVRAENPENPLSDDDIQKTLNQQGVAIARRTVAKYRKALKIPPSNLRRRE